MPDVYKRKLGSKILLCWYLREYFQALGLYGPCLYCEYNADPRKFPSPFLPFLSSVPLEQNTSFQLWLDCYSLR